MARVTILDKDDGRFLYMGASTNARAQALLAAGHHEAGADVDVEKLMADAEASALLARAKASDAPTPREQLLIDLLASDKEAVAAAFSSTLRARRG